MFVDPSASARHRYSGRRVAALVVTWLLLPLPLPSSAAELPARKAGLWEQRTTSDAASPSTVMQQCTDAAAEKAFQTLAASMGQQTCTRNETRRDGARWLTESVCTLGDIRVISKSTITGDFDSAYRMETETRFEPPLPGRKADRSITEARWLGACKADQRPGDMILSDGKKMNILQTRRRDR